MFRIFKLALALLLAIQAAVASPAREKTSFLQAESASTQQETCAECYEIESESAEPQQCLLDSPDADQRLTYEKFTDVFTSHREQTHVFLTLDNGQTLQATEGHPFLTSEGWRDAILLKKGGKLLIKGEANKDAGQEAKAKAIYKPNQPLAGIEAAQSAISIGAFL